MLKIKRQDDINFFSIPSLIALFSLLCATIGFLFPFFYNRVGGIGWTIIDIFKFNYTTINIYMAILIFFAILLYMFNLFIQPGWMSYFVCAFASIALCVGPTFVFYNLVPKLKISLANVSLHIGAVMMIISALIFAGLEIYRLGTLEKKTDEKTQWTYKSILKRKYFTKKQYISKNTILNKFEVFVKRTTQVPTEKTESTSPYKKNIATQQKHSK